MEQELITLGILFAFALIGGIIAARFKQPTLLGLLIVGALIGPHAFSLVKDQHFMESMIEFGAILMLFILGLEFDIKRLQKIGMKAITIAVLNSAILTFIGFTVSVLLGFDTIASLFIGVILAFGSTVVIVKVLENKGMMQREEVPLLIAILIIEDIIAVMVITFFSGVRDSSTGLIGNIENLVISMCVLVLLYFLFVKFVKPMLEWVLKSNNTEEIMTFLALGMCAGFAYVAYALHLSPAVGAFLAGSIVASLPNSKKFEHAIAPYNVIISAFFFIAIGTLIDLTAITQNIMIILVLVLTVIIIKLIAFSGMVYFFANMRGDKMFFSSMAMFSVGEFSLLVAKESTNFNIGIDLVSISAAIIAISAVLMSFTLNFSNKIYQPTKEHIPYSFRVKMEKFSNYIKAISEELDLNDRYSRGMKKQLFTTLGVLLAIMLVIFGWRKIQGLMINYEVSQLYFMLGQFITLSLIAILMFYFLYMCKIVVRSLGEILSNATNIRSAHQSRKIVRMAFVGIFIIMAAIFSPFVLFLFKAPGMLIAVSYILIAAGIFLFHKISHSIHERFEPSREPYPEFGKSRTSSNTKSINDGWEI